MHLNEKPSSSPSIVALSFVIAVAFLGCSETVVDFVDLTANGNEAVHTLKEAPALAGSSIGIAGTTPETVKAFRNLLAEPDAADAFKSVLESGTKPGKLYALAGLYFTDREYMEGAAPDFLADHSNVETIFGCIIDEQRVSKLTRRIVDGSLPRQFKGQGD